MESLQKKIKCIIVDDTPIQVELLTEDLQPYSELEIVLATTNPHEACEYLDKNSNDVDVAFIDMQMPGISGQYIIKKFGHHIHFVVISAFKEYISQTINYYGFNNYLLKPVNPEELRETVSNLTQKIKEKRAYQYLQRLNENSVFQEKTDNTLQMKYDKLQDTLSEREYEVAKQLAKGLSYKDIADKLYIDLETVRTHAKNIYRKTPFGSKQELMQHFQTQSVNN